MTLTNGIPESKVDVLIVGAGPAGLMAANGLSRAGVNVRIIDIRKEKVTAGQADGIQPRTVEVFMSYGLGERLLKEGREMHTAAFYNPGPNGGIERTSRAPDVTAPTARYPFEVLLNQGGIESIFIDSMKTRGVEVDRPVKPTDMVLSENEADFADPNAYPIKVTLQRLDVPAGQNDSEIVHAKYVLGGDGAHSWVRKKFDIVMEGEQTEFLWGVVDTVPQTNFPDIRNKSLIHSQHGSCMLIPREGDMVRLYLQIADMEAVNTGRVDRSKWGPERLQEVAKKILQPFELEFPAQCDWWTLYIIGQRVASKYTVRERVFIAGDACHTHSPKAGQGMNASMNDSHNLVWKLAYVLRGWASPDVLKTYEFERRKYAQDLIDFDKKFSALFSGKPRTEDFQDGVSHEDFIAAFQTFGGFTSGTGIRYLESDVVDYKHQSSAANLLIGSRVIPQIVVRTADHHPFEIQDLLPSDLRFKVLLFLGDLADEQQRAKVNAAAERMAKPGGFLTRLPPGQKKDDIFEILTISIGKKEDADYTDVPPFFRSHWSKAFLDVVDNTGKMGGKAYETYGISKDGAAVIVRPDGYVSMVAPLDLMKDVDAYFARFMKY